MIEPCPPPPPPALPNALTAAAGELARAPSYDATAPGRWHLPHAALHPPPPPATELLSGALCWAEPSRRGVGAPASPPPPPGMGGVAPLVERFEATPPLRDHTGLCWAGVPTRMCRARGAHKDGSS